MKNKLSEKLEYYYYHPDFLESDELDEYLKSEGVDLDKLQKKIEMQKKKVIKILSKKIREKNSKTGGK